MQIRASTDTYACLPYCLSAVLTALFLQAAIAKQIGLVALQLINSVIIPLNTTQYALELSDYLDGCVPVYLSPFSPSSDQVRTRIEQLASSLDFTVNFHPLHTAISKVRTASIKLDTEKVEAEKHFKELLDKLPKPSDDSLETIVRWIKWLLHLRTNPIREFIKAAKRVQSANQKLIGFERGFISEEGIKDREWYRHLAVAPGKWLGKCRTPRVLIYAFVR